MLEHSEEYELCYKFAAREDYMELDYFLSSMHIEELARLNEEVHGQEEFNEWSLNLTIARFIAEEFSFRLNVKEVNYHA